MSLLGEFIDKETQELVKEGVCVKFLGDLDTVPPELSVKIKGAVAATKDLDQLVLSIMLSYSGRQELLRSAKTLARRAMEGEDPAAWDESDLAATLYTCDLPEPDLLIRTGGEYRLSNFLLWQSAYTEFWFTPALWPDFGESELDEAISAYGDRHRRFGGV